MENLGLMKISVVTPVKGKPELTFSLLESLAKSDSPLLEEVVIVDNGEGDETARLLDEFGWGKARRVIGSPSSNFSQACNLGALKSRGDILLFLNNDMIVSEGWLAPLAETVADKGGAASSILLNTDGTIQQAGMRFGAWGLMYRVGAGAGGNDKRFRRTTLEWAVMGACFCVSREMFGKIGGWDARYHFGIEDADICLKTLEAGGRIRNVGSSVITHIESATLKENESAISAHSRNVAQFNGKWGGLVDRLTERHICGMKSAGVKTAAIFGTGSAAQTLRRKLEAGGVIVSKFITFDPAPPSIAHGLMVETASRESVRDVDRVIIGAQFVTMIQDRLEKMGLGGSVYGCDLYDESWTPGEEG
jgi:GT2 family glycosyltransferase